MREIWTHVGNVGNLVYFAMALTRITEGIYGMCVSNVIICSDINTLTSLLVKSNLCGSTFHCQEDSFKSCPLAKLLICLTKIYICIVVFISSKGHFIDTASEL